MLNKTLYPTPDPVIRKMLVGVNVREIGRIYDTSAGTGTILDYLVSIKGTHKKQLYAIEIDPDLVAILRHKEYNVVGYDFLEFTTHKIPGLVLMNPPFDNGQC